MAVTIEIHDVRMDRNISISIHDEEGEKIVQVSRGFRCTDAAGDIIPQMRRDTTVREKPYAQLPQTMKDLLTALDVYTEDGAKKKVGLI
jgi:hypothetical protein